MEYTLIYSKRKTISIEISPECEIIVRAPKLASRKQIEAFVASREEWIFKHLEIQKARQDRYNAIPKLTALEINYLADQAMKKIPERVKLYAPMVGVSYGRITIRNQATRWGSCSSKGNLNFNCLLMLVPEEVMDYVIIHELCHRIELNHSQAFWNEVARVCPEYKERRKWLKENGPGIIAMLGA